MPEVQGFLGFGRRRLGVSPYDELADPAGNAVDLWLERRLGSLISRLPFGRRRLGRLADGVMALEAEFARVEDDALRDEALGLRHRLLSNRNDAAALQRTFAVVREASWRVLEKRHYRVQIMGALALYEGRMIEMATGEGKTLTATPAAIVAALSGQPVHVVTVNDYLAARDAAETTPLYDFFGLTVGIIDSDMEPDARRAAYACDITYVSNNNVTFDYLRDRIATGQRRGRSRHRALELISGVRTGGPMLRGLAFAIVDEADSVFVDEARTPLILSATNDDAEAMQLYRTGLTLARALEPRRHYTIDDMNRQIRIEPAGSTALSNMAEPLKGLWKVRRAREELVQQALMALHMFKRGKDYVLQEGAVQIVDEYTGRIMPDRSWQGGLHQMIEAKEDVEVTGRKETLARITYQRYFRRYLRLAGMTGTGMELAGEFRDTFNLTTILIPRHRPLRRRHVRSKFLPDAKAKWDHLARTVPLVQKNGRPVLIGTRSVEASQAASDALNAAGLTHQVLNATQDAEEADIIAVAGQVGAITVATNIAGRGTDILPGEGVNDIGGLHVILTEYHESSRIDRQLFGRTGRQGAAGTTEAIVALDDEIFVRFAPRLLPLVKRLPILPLCNLLRRVAQARAEAEHATTRREQTKQDKQMERALAFTGPVE